MLVIIDWTVVMMASVQYKAFRKSPFVYQRFAGPTRHSVSSLASAQASRCLNALLYLVAVMA